jgi:hypothetical protein
VIAELAFGSPDGHGVRHPRFVPRTTLPLGAACLVANGLRETLYELLGERCELTIGEPAAIAPAAWETLSRDAHCFLTRGRQTDIVLIVPNTHARTLVLRAFGEGEPLGPSVLSTLELHAIERIAARCSSAFDPLYAERSGASHPVGAGTVPLCVAYFDVRIHAPIAIEIGIGIARELPDTGPAGRFPPALLAQVPVEVCAEFATGTMDIATLLGLEPGDVVALETQVGAPATLKIAGRRLASGVGGVRAGRYSFEVQTVATMGRA